MKSLLFLEGTEYQIVKIRQDVSLAEAADIIADIERQYKVQVRTIALYDEDGEPVGVVDAQYVTTKAESLIK